MAGWTFHCLLAAFDGQTQSRPAVRTLAETGHFNFLEPSEQQFQLFLVRLPPLQEFAVFFSALIDFFRIDPEQGPKDQQLRYDNQHTQVCHCTQKVQHHPRNDQRVIKLIRAVSSAHKIHYFSFYFFQLVIPLLLRLPVPRAEKTLREQALLFHYSTALGSKRLRIIEYGQMVYVNMCWILLQQAGLIVVRKKIIYV